MRYIFFLFSLFPALIFGQGIPQFEIEYRDTLVGIRQINPIQYSDSLNTGYLLRNLIDRQAVKAQRGLIEYLSFEPDSLASANAAMTQLLGRDYLAENKTRFMPQYDGTYWLYTSVTDSIRMRWNASNALLYQINESGNPVGGALGGQVFLIYERWAFVIWVSGTTGNSTFALIDPGRWKELQGKKLVKIE
jgi:hypothetical protein